MSNIREITGLEVGTFDNFMLCIAVQRYNDHCRLNISECQKRLAKLEALPDVYGPDLLCAQVGLLSPPVCLRVVKQEAGLTGESTRFHSFRAAQPWSVILLIWVSFHIFSSPLSQHVFDPLVLTLNLQLPLLGGL